MRSRAEDEDESPDAEQFVEFDGDVMHPENEAKLNFLMAWFLYIYRHTVLAFDIWVFFLKSIGEYFRLAFRLVYPRKMRSVAGEVALVTGAGHGIGKEVALQLASLGAILVCVDIDEDRNRQTLEEIRAEGGIGFAFTCDVSSRNAVCELGKQVREQVGDVNILVNNAGIMIAKPFLSQSDDEIERTINVNLLGQMWCLKEFLPPMTQMTRGSLVFMCGLPGHAGAPNVVPYSASKFAIRGMMESIYIELRQNYPSNRIHLMLVSPFMVETGMVKRHRIRFPHLMGIVNTTEAAEKIVTSLRRRAAIVFIPDFFCYLTRLVRILPAKIQLLLTDFFDTANVLEDDSYEDDDDYDYDDRDDHDDQSSTSEQE